MYGLAYCNLDYEYMYELDLYILVKLIKSVMDKEAREQDLEMQRLAWQTSYLMTATGNYKTPVKPDKLYTSIYAQKEKEKEVINKVDIEAKRKELLETFGINN